MTYTKPGFEIEAGHGGAIAMLLVPEDMSEEIRNWGMSHIDDAEVYGKDGKGRDGSPHITLQNGIMCDNGDELEKLFSQLPAMEAELGPISVFRNADKDYDVVHISVESDGLQKANAMLSDLLEVNDPHMKDYTPHITLAYVNRGAGARFDGLKDFVGKKVKLGRLAIDGKGIEPKMLDLADHEHVDQIPGGAADNMTEADFDQKALAEGAKHELEHTKNIELAREIAMDHLSEDPDYYKRLKQIEAKKSPGGKKECAHHWPGKRPGEGGWCGRCGLGSALKESMDYGSSRKAYLIEDAEDYLLSSGRSVGSLKPGELETILGLLAKDLKE